MTWLHFIGKSYYSMKEFISEAKKLGVSRRISRINARAMNFGDRVLLATWNPRTKHAQVFGCFRVERLSGLSSEALDTLKRKFKVTKVSDGGRRIARKCGSYIEGATYTVECSLRDILDAINNVKDTGKLLITGQYEDHVRFRLRDISHQLGYRKVNYDKLMAAVQRANRVNPLIPGQFYVLDKPTTEGGKNNSGLIGTVENYRKKEEGKTPQTQLTLPM